MTAVDDALAAFEQQLARMTPMGRLGVAANLIAQWRDNEPRHVCTLQLSLAIIEAEADALRRAIERGRDADLGESVGDIWDRMIREGSKGGAS
jgi:hypothetical protein